MADVPPFAEGRSRGELSVNGDRRPRPRFAIVVPGVLGSASRRIMTPRARSLRLPGSRPRKRWTPPGPKASGAPRIEDAEVERRKASWPQGRHVLPRGSTLDTVAPYGAPLP